MGKGISKNKEVAINTFQDGLFMLVKSLDKYEKTVSKYGDDGARGQKKINKVHNDMLTIMDRLKLQYPQFKGCSFIPIEPHICTNQRWEQMKKNLDKDGYSG